MHHGNKFLIRGQDFYIFFACHLQGSVVSGLKARVYLIFHVASNTRLSVLTFLQAYSIDCECGLTHWVYAQYTEDLLFLSARIISAQDEIYVTQSVREPEQNKASVCFV